MAKWKKYSLMIAIPATAALSIVNLGVHFAHGHDHPDESEKPSYMRIRNKPFPWSCPDCGLFEGPCWEKCKAAKEAGIAGHH